MQSSDACFLVLPGDFPETYVIREISDFFWDKVVLYGKRHWFGGAATRAAIKYETLR